ncbi:hypothetical protein CJ014_23620 [Pleomorphomonas carboxyditropha]|uniref:Uncharacterized protein n=1 Tax=Pleomorphomonas carboxyditropha TaxID=2023338 RepID=A0A2G9WQ88_9HYPH|nr:hypothetical protein CJ014_23620 [Pleomorphomonas carboxyditropha]
MSDVWCDSLFVAVGMAPDLPMMQQSGIVGIVGERTALSSCHRLEEFLERVGGRYQPLTGPSAGKLLHLTAEERWACSITTMMAIDETKAERVAAVAEDRRQRDRERKRRTRAGTVKKQRALYEAESLSNKRPWEELGISRRTWYRLGKPDPAAAEQVGTSMSALSI